MSVHAVKAQINPFAQLAASQAQQGQGLVQGEGVEGMDLLALLQAGGGEGGEFTEGGEAGEGAMDFSQALASLQAQGTVDPSVVLDAKRPMFAPKVMSSIAGQDPEAAAAGNNRKSFFPQSSLAKIGVPKEGELTPGVNVRPAQTGGIAALLGQQVPGQAAGAEGAALTQGMQLSSEEGALSMDRPGMPKARPVGAHKAYRQMEKESSTSLVGRSSAATEMGMPTMEESLTQGPIAKGQDGRPFQARPVGEAHGNNQNNQTLEQQQANLTQRPDLSLESMSASARSNSGSATDLHEWAAASRVSGKGDTKTLDLNSVARGNTAQVIDRIVAHVEAHKIGGQSSLDLTVRHEELGDFKLQVQKTRGPGVAGVDIQITPSTEAGQRFFAENEGKMLSSMSNAGVKVGDFKLMAGHTTGGQGSSSFHQEDSQDRRGSQSFSQTFSGQRGEAQSRQGQEQRDSQRRQGMWDAYRDRMVA